MGLKIALDDFGAGSSSYEQLKQVPLDFIKIDGALVRNLNENRFVADCPLHERCRTQM